MMFNIFKVEKELCLQTKIIKKTITSSSRMCWSFWGFFWQLVLVQNFDLRVYINFLLLTPKMYIMILSQRACFFFIIYFHLVLFFFFAFRLFVKKNECVCLILVFQNEVNRIFDLILMSGIKLSIFFTYEDFFS